MKHLYDILIMLTMITLILPMSVFGASWGMSGWSYRKSHLVTGSAGAGTNYQIRVVVHKSSGTDSGPDVYLGANVRDDFGDVRFTASDGTTALSYWLETGSLASGSQAAFWIKVTADLGSNQTIYIYYGNSSVTTTSSGANTFILFDDFTGGSLDGSKWTKFNGGALSFNTPSAGFMTAAFGTDPSKIIATGGPTADNNAILARFEITGGVGGDERAGVCARTGTGDGRGYNYLFHNFTSLNTLQFLDDGIVWGNATSFGWAKSTFYILEAFYASSTVYGRVNYGTWSTQTGWTARGVNYLSLNIGSTDAATVWDWAAIRKSILTEPANSIWGTEENFYSTWGMDGWTYRKCHTINATTGAGSNYQVSVTVNYGNGSDNGSTMYCNSHCQSDFSDIRFTSSDGSTQLNYWLQSYTASSSAVFWVKISADISSPQTIYMYYGKTGVSTTSNATNTFLFFDDGSSIGSWSVSGTAGSTAGFGNPQPSYFANGAAGNYLTRNPGLTSGTMTTFNVYTQTGNLGNFFFLCNAAGLGQMFRIDSRGGSFSGFATTTTWILWAAPASGFTAAALNWYKFGIAITASTSATYYYQQTTDATPFLPSTTLGTFTVASNGGYIGLVGDGAGSSLITYWDNIITRKYVNPEPTQSACGSEEPVLTLSTVRTNVTCFGAADGTITASVTGGTTPYAYSWNNAQTTVTISSLSPGTYSVTVTDNIGLKTTASATITQPAAVAVTSAATNVSCFGTGTGSITITAGGGTAPYSFSIQNGSDSYPGTGTNPYTFSNLTVGTYRVRAKDSNGCTSPTVP